MKGILLVLVCLVLATRASAAQWDTTQFIDRDAIRREFATARQLLDDGWYEEAIAKFRSIANVIGQDPTFDRNFKCDLYLYLGWALVAFEEYKAAEAEFRKMFALNPDKIYVLPDDLPPKVLREVDRAFARSGLKKASRFVNVLGPTRIDIAARDIPFDPLLLPVSDMADLTPYGFEPTPARQNSAPSQTQSQTAKQQPAYRPSAQAIPKAPPQPAASGGVSVKKSLTPPDSNPAAGAGSATKGGGQQAPPSGAAGGTAQGGKSPGGGGKSGSGVKIIPSPVPDNEGKSKKKLTPADPQKVPEAQHESVKKGAKPPADAPGTSGAAEKPVSPKKKATEKEKEEQKTASPPKKIKKQG